MTAPVTSGPRALREGRHPLADITAAIGRVAGSVTEVGADGNAATGHMRAVHGR